jgi:anti-anti-sigma factor
MHPSHPPAFGIDTARSGDAVRLAVRGELDLATAPAVDEALRAAAASARLVVLDLQGVTFLDSTGLRTVLQADARSRADGHDLVVVRGPQAVDRVFALAGVDGLVTLVDAPPTGAP